MFLPIPYIYVYIHIHTAACIWKKVKVAQSCPTLCDSMDYTAAAAAAAKSLQLCPTLWDPIDGSPPGSPVPGILQARTLEWVAISFSIAWKVKVKSLSRVRLLATPWTAAYQAPPSMGFSRQEYWSGLPLPSPMDYTVYGILQVRILEWVVFPFSKGSSQPRDQTQGSWIVGGFFTSWATREAHMYVHTHIYTCIMVKKKNYI